MFLFSRHVLIALTSTALAACGGGGGSDKVDAPPAGTPVQTVNAAVSPVAVALAKYEGAWRQDCVDHMRRTVTLAATGARVFTVTPQEQLFANADCTGDVVAVGSFGTHQETVRYDEVLAQTSVTLPNGEVVVETVDLGTSVQSVATFVYTGSGVVTTIDGGLTTLTRVNYADGGYANIFRAKTTGQTTAGGLLLFNGELLVLVRVPGSASSFVVNQRYVR